MKNKMPERRKHRRHFRFILMLISLLLLQAVALPSPCLFAMDLMEAYTRAKDHDPLLGSAFYEHEATKTFAQQGRSYLLPQMQASGAWSRYNFYNGPPYYIDYTSQYMGVNVKQPLFNVTRFYEYRQLKDREAIGAVRFVSAQQNLILRLAEAYFNGLAATNLLDLIDIQKKAVTEQIEQAKKMYKAGVATITDVHDAEARYDDVLSQEIDVKNNVDVKMQALKKIIGTEPFGLIALKEDIPLSVPEPETLDGWIEIAKKHHPGLKSYAYQIDYYQRELSKNKGQHWPSVDLVAGYTNVNDSNLVKTQDTSYGSVGMQVNLPLFSGGYASAKVAESRAVLEQGKKDYENALAETVQKLSEAYLGIRGSISKIGALSTAVKSASTSLHSNRMGLIAGVKTTVDVLNAQRELYNVRSRLLQARYEYLLNIVRLKSSAGTLAEGDLLAINQWLK